MHAEVSYLNNPGGMFFGRPAAANFDAGAFPFPQHRQLQQQMPQQQFQQMSSPPPPPPSHLFQNQPPQLQQMHGSSFMPQQQLQPHAPQQLHQQQQLSFSPPISQGQFLQMGGGQLLQPPSSPRLGATTRQLQSFQPFPPSQNQNGDAMQTIQHNQRQFQETLLLPAPAPNSAAVAGHKFQSQSMYQHPQSDPQNYYAPAPPPRQLLSNVPSQANLSLPSYPNHQQQYHFPSSSSIPNEPFSQQQRHHRHNLTDYDVSSAPARRAFSPPSMQFQERIQTRQPYHPQQQPGGGHRQPRFEGVPYSEFSRTQVEIPRTLEEGAQWQVEKYLRRSPSSGSGFNGGGDISYNRFAQQQQPPASIRSPLHRADHSFSAVTSAVRQDDYARHQPLTMSQPARGIRDEDIYQRNPQLILASRGARSGPEDHLKERDMVNLFKKTSLDFLKEYFQAIVDIEREIEASKIKIAKQEDFSVQLFYEIFDPTGTTNALTVDKIMQGLNRLRINADESDIKLLIQRYSHSRTPQQLDQQEFINMVVPQTCKQIDSMYVRKAYISERNMKDETRDLMGKILKGVLNQEVVLESLRRKMEDNKIDTRDLYQVLQEGNGGNSQNPTNKQNLREFLVKVGIFVNKEEIPPIITRFDAQDMGFFRLQEFTNELRPRFA